MKTLAIHKTQLCSNHIHTEWNWRFIKNDETCLKIVVLCAFEDNNNLLSQLD